MKLNELYEQVVRLILQGHGDLPVMVFGVYASVGDIEKIYLNEDGKVICFESDIMSG